MPSTVFAEVRIEETSAASSALTESSGGVVELTVIDATLRGGSPVPASRVQDLLRAARSA